MLKKLILISLVIAGISCSEKNEVSDVKSSTNLDENKIAFQDSLAFELCTMYGLDQGIRDTKNYDKSVIMPKVDSLNFKRLVSFVKDNGFPNQQLLGTRFAGHECVEFAAMAIMLHNPHRLVNEKEYFNLFLEEVEKGNLPRSHFVDVLDKYYFMKSGWQHAMYGSQFGQPCITTKKQTNKLREEVGLEPLKDEEFKDCD
ncbi:MAG: hypothetical protein LAT51_11775 [Flavobacteriaceae bacterium]|nr:hypothetical protein [Flavobacteriaceae bacterium]